MRHKTLEPNTLKIPDGNCNSCRHKRGMANSFHHGKKIPDGPGKCTRPGGLCLAKKAHQIRGA